LPGFIDRHAHPVEGGLERGMLDLVVDRREQKAVVARALRFLQA